MIQNCVTDLESCLESLANGIRNYKINNYWQAENFFRVGFSALNGDMFADFNPLVDEKNSKEAMLKSVTNEASTYWSLVVIKHGTVIPEDLGLLERAISHDSIGLVRNLYQFYATHGLKPEKIITRFRQELEKTFDEPEEIEQSLNDLWSDEND